MGSKGMLEGVLENISIAHASQLLVDRGHVRGRVGGRGRNRECVRKSVRG